MTPGRRRTKTGSRRRVRTAPPGALREHSDEALLAIQARCLEEHPAGADLWVFAYGSLVWSPEIEFAERRIADVTGWHRSFCLWQWRYRGSPAAPNLMLALEEGGRCRGLALRVAGGADLQQRLLPLIRRELSGDGYVPAWVTARTDDGPMPALTFVVNRNNRTRYAGRLPEKHVAEVIAAAHGDRGTGAEYLCATETALRAAGVFDRRLARLRTLVAARGGTPEPSPRRLDSRATGRPG